MRSLVMFLALMSSAANAEIFLVGTITGNPSIATIRSGDRVYSLRVGEPVDGWVIKKISAKEVVISSPSMERVIKTGEYLANEKLVKGLEVKGDEIHMTREVHKYIAEESLTTIVMDATADPVYNIKGDIVGYHIWNFDPGSVYDLAGLQNGDIVTAIDSQLLGTPSEAISILKQVKTRDKFSVTLTRNGETKTLKVLVH